MTIGLGVMIEGLVAVLLLITIAYCITLNKRLSRLKADEQTLKATISELITATEIAERAVAGLKLTVQECDQSLGERLHAGATMLDAMTQQVAAGEQVVGKLAQIAGLSRVIEAAAPTPAAPPNLKATVAAAQAFAARSRMRGQGVAA
jgi:acyl CoA:acetate/3-ketoacid CoA transferase alpha subunit